ncbi:MAG: RNA 2',3'-cyclic phosphodiesterase [Desulfobacteraceae bacterium]|nr:RNA 2',3'-cyclic phosphodiesterase [Desulfobacteraceae bacterium]
MKTTLRLFIAIDLPAVVVDSIKLLQGQLKARGLKLGWVKPYNAHLTLKFLGNIPEAKCSPVADAMHLAAGNFKPMDLTMQGMGVFPGIRKPRVLWTGLGGQTALLKDFFCKLEDALSAYEFEREKRPFKAHLTLARFKKKINSGDLLEAIQSVGSYEPIAFTARQIVLYKSDLLPTGARYTALYKAKLAGIKGI